MILDSEGSIWVVDFCYTAALALSISAVDGGVPIATVAADASAEPARYTNTPQ
ncbi:MAG: hypothetical protein ABIX10_00970 [Acidimicrobiales bacterium]